MGKQAPEEYEEGFLAILEKGKGGARANTRSRLGSLATRRELATGHGSWGDQRGRPSEAADDVY